MQTRAWSALCTGVEGEKEPLEWQRCRIVEGDSSGGDSLCSGPSPSSALGKRILSVAEPPRFIGKRGQGGAFESFHY